MIEENDQQGAGKAEETNHTIFRLLLHLVLLCLAVYVSAIKFLVGKALNQFPFIKYIGKTVLEWSSGPIG